jgi:hypothetical protein
MLKEHSQNNIKNDLFVAGNGVEAWICYVTDRSFAKNNHI